MITEEDFDAASEASPEMAFENAAKRGCGAFPSWKWCRSRALSIPEMREGFLREGRSGRCRLD